MNNKEGNPLKQVFSLKLLALYALEKEISKIYKKMGKAALAAPLQKAVSPFSTEIDAHQQRLKLIIEIESIKPAQYKDLIKDQFPDFVSNPALVKFSKGDQRDLDIILNAMLIQQYKIAIYEFLYVTTIELKSEQSSILLDQIIKDNKNTYGWLVQLLQNSASPVLNLVE